MRFRLWLSEASGGRVSGFRYDSSEGSLQPDEHFGILAPVRRSDHRNPFH